MINGFEVQYLTPIIRITSYPNRMRDLSIALNTNFSLVSKSNQYLQDCPNGSVECLINTAEA